MDKKELNKKAQEERIQWAQEWRKKYGPKNPVKKKVKTKKRTRPDFTQIVYKPAKTLEQIEKAKQQKREYVQQWAKNNPGKISAKRAKRRAAKLQRTPKWLSKEQLRLIEDIYIKSVELAKSTGIEHHVDHIVPLQGKTVSGLHVPWNLQILTAKENLVKSNQFELV